MAKGQSFDEAVGSTVTTEETALATLEDAPAAVREYTDNPDFDKDDVSYPRLRLAQGLTQEVQDGIARPGDWVLSGYEPEKSVTLIPLLAAKLHERRREDGEGVETCQNHGGDQVCPDTKWLPNPKDPKKNLPPVCGVAYSYVAYSVTHDALVSVDFRKSATTTGKTVNTMIAGRGLGRFGITLSAKSNQGPRGSFYTPAVVPAKVSDEDFDRARQALG